MNTAKEFWDWFESNEYLLRKASHDEKQKVDCLYEKLNEIDEGLFPEICISDSNNVELVISAGGNLDLFNKIEDLVKAAPPLPHWTVTAFKQPMGFDFVTNYEGLILDCKDLLFDPLRNKNYPGQLGLRVFVPNYEENDHRRFFDAVDNILYTGLGEFIASVVIKHLEVRGIQQEWNDEFLKLTELPAFIDSLEHNPLN